jgi:ABC-2 type transport system ATP-binding protein
MEESQVIKVENVTKKYGNFVAVNDISFEINDHEVVGFLGPNGAGKSTTMNMITGFIEPTKGKIIVDGYDISKSPKKAKGTIGYMPEGVPLYYDLTVKEFISYMADLKNVKRKDKKEAIENVMKETGLLDVQNKLTKNLSRGYKQRVSLAGALIGNPDVLILDEPTVGLDPKQIAEIRELIKSLGKKHTVILSSHILSEVSQICERVIIINHGKIVAVDTPEHLEKETQSDNRIVITVEENENKLQDVCEKIKDIKSVKLLNNNDDGTVRYLITAKADSDVRKELFNVLPKNDITIFELKNDENTLEDAFLRIINEKDEEIREQSEKETVNKEKEGLKKDRTNKGRINKKQDRKQETEKEKQERKQETKKEKQERKQETKKEKGGKK